MRVVVETPKWSFVKYRFRGGVFVRDLVSPFPSLFNYGFAEGSLSADYLPQDVIVLGPRLPQGKSLDVNILGYVQFIDKGVHDDKVIASASGKIDAVDKIRIFIFFSFYRIFKIFYYLIKDLRLEYCRFEGIIVNDMQ